MSSRPSARAKRNPRLYILVLLMLLPLNGAKPAEVKENDKDPQKTGANKAEPNDTRSLMPFGVGLTETAGVTLTLLDVEVRDKKGRPVRGLRKQDFRVKLGATEWPIYSVDDLCSCEDSVPDARRREGSAAAAGAAAPSAGTAPRRPDRPAGAKERGGADAGGGAGDEVRGTKGSEVAGGEARGTKGGETAAGEPHPPDDPLRFVLFFDFGELQLAGRSIALKDARRWIREVKLPGEEAMIAGYTEQAGLAEICPFTTDASRLLSALEKAEHDPKLQDSFPSMIHLRVEECARDVDTCDGHARDEYAHARHSLLGLKLLLSTLEAIPGRKALIDFQENGIVFPGRIYRARAGDTIRLLEEIGAEANLSRTSVHAAYVGDRLGAGEAWQVQLTDGAVNLGSNLADFTGGTYNLDRNALSSLTSAVRGGCACIYRLGFEPPPEHTRRIYHALVEVRGRPLPYSYRVAFLDDLDRWLTRAVEVLMKPEQAKGLRIGAALLPIRATGGRWDVYVEIALDLDAIEAIPGADGSRGSWETGAFLASDDGSQAWEMMGISGFRRSGGAHSGAARDGAAWKEAAQSSSVRGQTALESSIQNGVAATAGSGEVVLHERLIEGLESGRFTLRAFVRDRTAALFGGAEAVLDLPRTRGDALAGPVLLRPDRRHLLAALPVFSKKGATEVHVTEVRTGEIPAWSASVSAGEPLEAVTWLCPRSAAPSSPGAVSGQAQRAGAAALVDVPPGSIVRYVEREGKPLFGLPAPHIESAGECARVADRLETGELAPGEYRYVLSWKTAKGPKPVRAEARFSVDAPAPPAAGIGAASHPGVGAP